MVSQHGRNWAMNRITLDMLWKLFVSALHNVIA